jgi:uncharacterized protein YpmB
MRKRLSTWLAIFIGLIILVLAVAFALLQSI